MRESLRRSRAGPAINLLVAGPTLAEANEFISMGGWPSGIRWESVGWNPTAAWPAALRRPSSAELQFWPGHGPLIRTGCSKDCQGPWNHARLLSCVGTVSLHRAATLSLCVRTPYRVVERRTGRGQESGFRESAKTPVPALLPAPLDANAQKQRLEESRMPLSRTPLAALLPACFPLLGR